MALPGFIEKAVGKSLTSEARLGSVLRGLGGMGRAGKADMAAIKRAERIGSSGVMGDFYRADNRMVRRGMRRVGYGAAGAGVVGRSSGSRGVQGRSSGGYNSGMYGY